MEATLTERRVGLRKFVVWLERFGLMVRVCLFIRPLKTGLLLSKTFHQQPGYYLDCYVREGLPEFLTGDLEKAIAGEAKRLGRFFIGLD